MKFVYNDAPPPNKERNNNTAVKEVKKTVDKDKKIAGKIREETEKSVAKVTEAEVEKKKKRYCPD